MDVHVVGCLQNLHPVLTSDPHFWRMEMIKLPFIVQPWSTLERKRWHLPSDPEINWKKIIDSKTSWLTIKYCEALPHRGAPTQEFHLLCLIRPHHSTVWVCTGCLIAIFLTSLCSLTFSLDHVAGWHYQRSCTQLQLEQRSNKLLLKTPLQPCGVLIFMMSCVMF